MKRIVAGLVAGVVLGACASAPPRPKAEPASLSVEVARGVPVPAAGPPRIALLVDATASMRTAAVRGVSRLAAAQTRALEILETAPEGTSLSVDVLGPGEGGDCRPSVLLPGDGRSPEVKGAILGLAPGGEGSLAESLDAVARGLRATGGVDGTRVVVLTDLEQRCGGDLCDAVAGLVDAGASVDFVVFGGRPTPKCVASAKPGPGPGAAAPAAGPPDVRVMPASGAPVTGVADGRPVEVPSGPARVEVALDPPLQLGPLPLPPGSLVRLRILDFPSASPPQREWVLEVVEAGADAAPSPRP